MNTCNDCKYGVLLYDNVADRFYYRCGVDGDIINDFVALDSTKDCDFYVNKLHGSATKE